VQDNAVTLRGDKESKTSPVLDLVPFKLRGRIGYSTLLYSSVFQQDWNNQPPYISSRREQRDEEAIKGVEAFANNRRE